MEIRCFEIEQMIPKLVHQIWMQGKDTVPQKYTAARKTWQALHPEWKIVTWDEVDLQNLAKGTEWETALRLCRRLIQRADVLRCVALETFGGVYVDMDMYALKPLDPLLLEHTDKIQVGETSFKGVPWVHRVMRLNNGLIIAPPRHPFWRQTFLPQLLLRLQTNTLLDDIAPAWNTIRTTGPGLWSHFDGSAHVHVLPQEHFYSLKKIKGHLGDLTQDDRAILSQSFVYHMQDSAWLVSWEKHLLHAFIGNNWMISVPILCLVVILVFVAKLFKRQK